jgi:hypothetical protein
MWAPRAPTFPARPVTCHRTSLRVVRGAFILRAVKSRYLCALGRSAYVVVHILCCIYDSRLNERILSTLTISHLRAQRSFDIADISMFPW